jgi:hypothetical protein
VAEANFPLLTAPGGMSLQVLDTFGDRPSFKYRYWLNNNSRMYLMESTQDVQRKFKLGVGDVLMFGKTEAGEFVVAGRKGTKDDVSRKPPSRKSQIKKGSLESAKRLKLEDGTMVEENPEEASLATGLSAGKAAGASKSKRTKKKASLATPSTARQPDVRSAYTYWNGYSLPVRRDGVFRAVPVGTGPATLGVSPEHGCWTSLVLLAGEPFQAFFDAEDAAQAAYEAARQNPAPLPQPNAGLLFPGM